MRRDLGDFQTPPELVAAVLETLGPIGEQWPRVLEPTCGRGHFLAGLLAQGSPPREIHGVEIQPEHCLAAKAMLSERGETGSRVAIHCADLFQLDLGRDLDWQGGGPMLVVGNPPWVTAAALTRLEAPTVAPRSNLKRLRGLEARTGSSNFDLAESIWLKLAIELADESPTIAMLCKTSVARALLQFAHAESLPLGDASIRRINAARWFGASVDACLFRATIASGDRAAPIPVYRGLGTADDPVTVIAFERGRLIADYSAYRQWSFVEGIGPRDWRQGIKHDAAAIMELAVEPGTGRLQNGRGEVVDIETEYVYPMVKGADLKRPAHEWSDRALIVTQRRIGEETSRIEAEAPRLWAYLGANGDRLDGRRSSIYRDRPRFAIFGVGSYSFAPYKLAISGLHKTPRFRVVGPRGGRPTMLDDTAYFLPCDSAAEAVALASLANDPAALGFLAASSFTDAKRPITKALLQRLDLTAILGRADRAGLFNRATSTIVDELQREPTAEMLKEIEHHYAGLERPEAAPA